MESFETEIVSIPHSPDFRTRWVINSKVTDIREESSREYVKGIGNEAIFKEVSKGWFLYLEGSHEALHVGMEKPELEKGDRVKITLEKVIV